MTERGLPAACIAFRNALHLRHHAHGVGVQGAARKVDRVELIRAGILDRTIDFDLDRLVDVMADALDFSGLWRKDSHLCSSLPQRLYRLRQFGIFKTVCGKNRDTEAAQFGHSPNLLIAGSRSTSMPRFPSNAVLFALVFIICRTG
jgi:hypothetical protein